MKEIGIMTFAAAMTILVGCVVGLALLQFTPLAPIWSMLLGTILGMAIWCLASSRYMKPPGTGNEAV
jgi:hypothetical protein